MKTHRKTLAALVFAVTALFTAVAAISAEEYVIGEEYYKDFPGSGYQLMEVRGISEYDERGNEIHWQSSPVYEVWYKYDEQGNLIYEKQSNGYELWYEYDENGNLVYMSDSDGEKKSFDYYREGNLLHKKDSYGNEWWYEYDEDGNLIYEKNGNKYGSYEYESWYEYDERGNIIHRIDSSGKEWLYEYIYRPDGTRNTCVLFVRKFNPSKFTFPPGPTSGHEPGKAVEQKEVAIEAGGIYRVSENLRLRENENTVGEIITTMQAGTLVKVLSLGKEETIDGIKSNWARLEVQIGGRDRDGNLIKPGTKGWCFGGYLKIGEYEESELFVSPSTAKDIDSEIRNVFSYYFEKISDIRQVIVCVVILLIIHVPFIFKTVKIIKAIKARKKGSRDSVPVSSLVLIGIPHILTLVLLICLDIFPIYAYKFYFYHTNKAIGELLILGFLLSYFCSNFLYSIAGIVVLVRKIRKKKETSRSLRPVIAGEVAMFVGIMAFFFPEEFLLLELLIFIISLAAGTMLITAGVLRPKENKKVESPE